MKIDSLCNVCNYIWVIIKSIIVDGRQMFALYSVAHSPLKEMIIKNIVSVYTRFFIMYNYTEYKIAVTSNWHQFSFRCNPNGSDPLFFFPQKAPVEKGYTIR